MKDSLKSVLTKIGEDYKEVISHGARHYLEVSIARKAAELGLKEAEVQYRDVYAIVPLKNPLNGMKVRIDGRTFIKYAQFDSGVVVPHYIARQADLSYRAYTAWDSMICNFA
jgi:hypothetical protein